MTCSVDGCERATHCKGMCNRHYENLRLRGAAVPVRDLPLAQRLGSVGWTVTAAGCKEWNGRRNEMGYGLYNHARVHRLVYELEVGPIPEGLLLRHTCDNPPCCNVEHLLPGTDRDNSNDKLERRGHWTAGLDRCRKGLHDRMGPGDCGECSRARRDRWEANRKALHS